MPRQRGQWEKKKSGARIRKKLRESGESARGGRTSSSVSDAVVASALLRFLFSSSLPPSSLGISKLGEDDTDVDGKEDGRRLQPPGDGRFLSLSLSLRFSISLFRFSDFHFYFRFRICLLFRFRIPFSHYILDLFIAACRAISFSTSSSSSSPKPGAGGGRGGQPATGANSPSLVLEFLPGRIFLVA